MNYKYTKSKTRDDLVLEVLRRMKHGEFGDPSKASERRAKACVRIVLNALATVIVDSANSENKRVTLVNFGGFHLRESKERYVRYPSNPEKRVHQPPYRYVRFVPCGKLRQRIRDTRTDD